MPALAFVVPVFKQGTLLAEAIRSVVRARDMALSRSPIVVVNDGCSFPSTHATALSLSRSVQQLHYVATQNRGLSAARNKGVEFILEQIPETEAIYFLDADNEIEPYSIRSMVNALRAHDADWFYPNIHMFGVAWAGDYSGPYSPLVEALANVCEAGSLVRTRIFASGLRYDEAMRLGYEDWDFWLCATEKGFRGRHLPELGLRYRKRPESMLSGSVRDDTEIMKYLYKKHEWMSHPKSLLQLESSSNPRYALALYDQGVVTMISGSTVMERLSLDAYRSRVMSSLINPTCCDIGGYFAVCSSGVFAELVERRLLAWTLYDLQARTVNNALSMMHLRRGAVQSIRIRVPVSAGESRSHLCCMKVDLLRSIIAGDENLADWPLFSRDAHPRLSTRTVELAQTAADADADVSEGAVSHLAALCSNFHAKSHPVVANWPVPAASFGPPHRYLHSALIAARIGATHAISASPGDFIDIAFVFSTFEFTEIERGIFHLCENLKRSGFRCHAVVYDAQKAKWEQEVLSVFESVRFGQIDVPRHIFSHNYDGTALPPNLLEEQRKISIGHFADIDIVVSCHSVGFWGIAGLLRKWGMLVVSYNPIDDSTPVGHSMDNFRRSIAYEHTIDLYVASTTQLAQKLLGFGVPPEKIASISRSEGGDGEMSPARDRSWDHAVTPLARRLTDDLRARRRTLDRQRALLSAEFDRRAPSPREWRESENVRPSGG